MWGGGCGHGESNPVHVHVQKFTYLEPDSIISSLFVQSVIFGHTLCGLLNKLEGYVCEEVGVGRWVWMWGGGCGCGFGEVGVGGGCGRFIWVRGGGCGCEEVGLVIGR